MNAAYRKAYTMLNYIHVEKFTVVDAKWSDSQNKGQESTELHALGYTVIDWKCEILKDKTGQWGKPDVILFVSIEK